MKNQTRVPLGKFSLIPLLQDRTQIYPIQVLGQWGLTSRKFVHGGKVIPLSNWKIALRICGNTGTRHDHGNPNTPFPHPGFSSLKWFITGSTPIIGRKDYKSIFVQTKSLKFIKHHSNRGIHIFHHCRIVGPLPMTLHFRWHFICIRIKF